MGYKLLINVFKYHVWAHSLLPPSSRIQADGECAGSVGHVD